MAGACARGNELTAEDAVTILVYDGLDQRTAACIVDAVDGRLDLAAVTGVAGSLDDTELEVLAAAARSCRPPVTGTAGRAVTATGGADPAVSLLGPDEFAPDEGTPASSLGLSVDELEAELTRGGMDPDLAACVAVEAVRRADAGTDPDRARIEALVHCEHVATTTVPGVGSAEGG